ncbi:MAG: hypothetical protein JRI95_08515 [Deltaproteobacteria bacterium]|nr:hypothetical protein [Deltaproteobacteria bacterium]
MALFIVDAPIVMGERQEAFLDQLEMIFDLEGKVFSNVQDNVNRFRFINFMSLKDMAPEIRKYDVLITF